jgi:putative hemolysin
MGSSRNFLAALRFCKTNFPTLETEPDSLLNIFSTLLPLSTLAHASLEVFGALFFIGVLLIFSALISSSEVAFFSLTHNDFDRLREENSGSARRILKLKEKPRTLLATILIGNNFINVSIVLIADYLLANLIPEEVFLGWASELKAWFTFLSSPEESIARAINFLLTVLSVTFILVLFGEVAPKIYAKLNNMRIAKFMSAPLQTLMAVFYPLSRLLVKGSNVIERKLENRTQAGATPSREEIGAAIELTVHHDVDASAEINILKRIVQFGDVTVKQIMRTRVDVVSVDEKIGYDELLEVIKESGYSRIPVYRDDFDHVVGILYVKDLLGKLKNPDEFLWQSLLRQPLFVPEAKKINDMLKEFQSSRMHMAVVVDEYGGTSGIVTMEDILEEVIGEIKDEFDDEVELQYQQLDAHNFLFEGKTLLNDVCRILDIDKSSFDKVRGEADSLAGLILENSGQLPKKGAEYRIQGIIFKILAVSKRRIEQIQVTLPDGD